MPNPVVNRRVVMSGVAAFDAAALAFFTAAGITDPTQKSAVNALVVSLKANNLWALVHALYPFVGGSDTAHAVNLKTPGTFNITWGGTVTHDANGITGNGSTGWGNTFFDFSANGSQNSAGLGCYCRTQTPTDGGCFICGVNTAGTARAGLLRTGANLVATGINHAFNNNAVGASTDFRGFLMASRDTSSTQDVQVRTATSGDDTTPTSANCNQDIAVLCRAWTTFGNDLFTNANLAAAWITSGLTLAEMTTLKTAVDTFQTSLGRNA